MARRRVIAEYGIGSEVRVLSRIGRGGSQRVRCEAEGRGLQVIVAGAGGSAHLAGVAAAHTTLPVIGVPLASSPLSGFDALLSTWQMPPGIPVATVGVGPMGAANAGHLAAAILALTDPALLVRMQCAGGGCPRKCWPRAPTSRAVCRSSSTPSRPAPLDAGGSASRPPRSLWLAALLSLALNAAGLTWGLPARWHPDEKADVTSRMVGGAGLSPDSFVNPSLPLYVMLGPVWLQDRAARWVAAGHAAIRCCSAAPVHAGRRPPGPAGAGLAAWRTHPASARPRLPPRAPPGLVNLCHFATPDHGCCWAPPPRWRGRRAREGRASAALVGLVLGLTASAKYTAAALVVPVLAAVWLRDPSHALAGTGLARRSRPGALAGGLALVLGGDTASPRRACA